MNREFARLVKASGWTQKEVARQLNLTPGAVSHIMNGRNRPSQAVLRLFKMISGGGRGGAAKPGKSLEAWEQQVLRKLRAVKPAQRQRVIAAIDKMIRGK